jgi:hypothetical protein
MGMFLECIYLGYATVAIQDMWVALLASRGIIEFIAEECHLCFRFYASLAARLYDVL